MNHRGAAPTQKKAAHCLEYGDADFVKCASNILSLTDKVRQNLFTKTWLERECS